MPRSVCIISTKTPYQGHFAREALDAALVSASYDIPTSLILMGEGVYQLLVGQSPEQLPRKNLSSLFKSLPLYGIEQVYIDEHSLTERHLLPEQLLPNHVLLSQTELKELLNKHDKVLNF